jgi:hypothetical protein
MGDSETPRSAADMSEPVSGIRVNGRASAEELAAVIAMLSGRPAQQTPSRYEQWRAGRLASLRPSADKRRDG